METRTFWVWGCHSAAQTHSYWESRGGAISWEADRKSYKPAFFRKMYHPALLPPDVMDTEKCHSLPWGERGIESRDTTWLISAVSPILKKKKEKKKEEVGGVEKAKHPTKEAAGKLIVFLISKNTIKSQMLPLGGRLFAFFFLGTVLAAEQ